LLDLELRSARVGDVRWEALDVVHAAVQGEGARSDLGDLAGRSFGSTLVVSAGDLDFTHSERLDAIELALDRGADEEALRLYFDAAQSPLREGVAGPRIER
jgi:hypothetical protein